MGAHRTLQVILNLRSTVYTQSCLLPYLPNTSISLPTISTLLHLPPQSDSIPHPTHQLQSYEPNSPPRLIRVIPHPAHDTQHIKLTRPHPGLLLQRSRRDHTQRIPDCRTHTAQLLPNARFHREFEPPPGVYRRPSHPPPDGFLVSRGQRIMQTESVTGLSDVKQLNVL